MFQFLIGISNMNVRNSIQEEKAEFQFLIGISNILKVLKVA